MTADNESDRLSWPQNTFVTRGLKQLKEIFFKQRHSCFSPQTLLSWHVFHNYLEQQMPLLVLLQ